MSIRTKKQDYYAIVIPVANEAETIKEFCHELLEQIHNLKIRADIFFIIDKASKDTSRKLLDEIAKEQKTVHVVYEPRNRYVADAYVRGFREAIAKKCDIIIEMDAGFSHLPKELPLFINGFKKGYDCVFGIRNMWSKDYDVPFKRRLFSLGGTIIANVLLGTKYRDMTSGYEGFKRQVLEDILKDPIQSTAHFFQTEIRYRARKYRYLEVPITYSAPSPRVSNKSVQNSVSTLLSLTFSRLMG